MISFDHPLVAKSPPWSPSTKLGPGFKEVEDASPSNGVPRSLHSHIAEEANELGVGSLTPGGASAHLDHGVPCNVPATFHEVLQFSTLRGKGQ